MQEKSIPQTQAPQSAITGWLGYLLVAALLFAPAAGRAQTIKSGGDIIDETWTVAGSPYIVQGDLTVPESHYLVIEAGVEVRFADGDLTAGGRDSTRAEITVDGTLSITGTALSPVTFGAQSGDLAGTWYGFVITANATAAGFQHAQIEHAVRAISNEAPGTVLTLADTAIHKSSAESIYLTAGHTTLTRLTARQNLADVVWVGAAASAVVIDGLLHHNDGCGVSVLSNTASETIVDGCTLHQNHTGVYRSGSAALTLKNSNITLNTYGINSEAAPLQPTHCNVHNNTHDYTNANPGTGCLSSNPLYVGSWNLRLTSNSPSRFARDSGGDLGPLPYTDDPTPGLRGVLWTNLHLTVAESPYLVTGDLTVSPNVTLTIDPGVTLEFSAADFMDSGYDPNKVELIVEGTLHAVGTLSDPIVMTRYSTGHWHGVRFIDSGSSANSALDFATLRWVAIGVDYDAPHSLTMTGLTIREIIGSGVHITNGILTLDRLFTRNAPNHSVRVWFEGIGHVQNAIIHNSGNGGIGFAVSSNATTGSRIVNSTIYGKNVGVSVNADAAVAVTNCIITANSTGIVQYGTPDVQISYSNVWGNNINYSGAAPGPGCLAENPDFVDEAARDFHLTATSPCLDTGTAAGAPDHDYEGALRPQNGDMTGAAIHDMGAYELSPGPFCGDSIVNNDEVCDDGAQNGTYGHCRADCTAMGPTCGDATLDDPPEQCDDGNNDNTDGCVAGCVAATCGDGYIWAANEQCDDGNTQNTDACLDSCVAAVCGDGYVWAGHEECDDDNDDNTDGCVAGCVAATCGDGHVWAGVEGCDDGNNIDDDDCTNACALPTCGDGIVQSGEACDDGNDTNDDQCTNVCTLPTCGDGIVQSGEQCDDGSGNSDTTPNACRTTCTLPTCGDGVVDSGEGCDDGNFVDDDECTNECVQATCGDGTLNPAEQCDDANDDNTDGCLDTCVTATCGDGFVWAGQEECDDANDDNTDGCLDTCVTATCGDGFVWAGQEECDDGNTIAGDGCDADCALETKPSPNGTGSNGGCGCRTNDHHHDHDRASVPAATALFWLLALAVIAVCRRRRRKAAGRAPRRDCGRG
jgi:cysteine-rich repeat protein